MILKSAVSSIASLVNLPRRYKKLIQFSLDTVLLATVYIFVLSLLPEVSLVQEQSILGLFFVFFSLSGLLVSGIYKIVLRFSGIYVLRLIVQNQIFAIIACSALSVLVGHSLNAVNLLLLFLLSVCSLGGARLFAREIIFRARVPSERLVIYGAGNAGTQLLASLRQSDKYEVVGFVDDANYLKGTKVHEIEVYSSARLFEIITKKSIGTVVLAMPGASRQQFRRITDRLQALDTNVSIKTVPTISDLLEGKGVLSDLHEVKIEELLGREVVPPREELLNANIAAKVVLVTGAGGSIGSELCRQIIRYKPKRLIMLDHSELALYVIQQEFELNWGHLIGAYLVSVTDNESMERIMINECVDSVYHAAAYKHVPLVEANPFGSIINNVIGTKNTLEAAVKANVSSFTLISTDKAVRPTNIMGASKRLAEILCQLANEELDCNTKIALVRFGNVLGSSGSVLPKFRDQIKAGGPVTITHPDITRYFMLIPEAVQLVLQASSMADGGEVFVLDMGHPVKIVDLAEKLIRLSGNQPYYSQACEPRGIKIEFTGLRPGEKLFEELLISGTAEPTEHPQIRKIKETHPTRKEFDVLLRDLLEICSNLDLSGLHRILHNNHIHYSRSEEANKTESRLGFDEADAVNNAKNFALTDTYNEVREPNIEVDPDIPPNQLVEHDGFTGLRNSLKISGERFFSRLLHICFLVVRPLTMGVRGVLLNNKNEILLVKHTYVAGWHLPGGGINKGESAQDALLREIMEETGFTIVGVPKIIGIFHSKTISKRDHVVLFFSENFSLSDETVKTFEIKDAKFFPFDSLPADLEESSKEWLLSALESKSH